MRLIGAQMARCYTHVLFSKFGVTMTQPIKRFIAGAVCPKCGAMDTVRAYEQDGQLNRECVSCDFNDNMDADNGPDIELPTRVNQSDKLVFDEGEQVVKLIN